MEKKYTSKVIQYSLDGKIVKTFKNAREATSVVNYDSIINCCKGKYKTAGGYIWRFEEDPFSLKSPQTINASLKCGICGSEESIKSIAMHLKWAHNMTTEDYVKYFGEFRPKKLKKEEDTNKSGIKCEVCGKPMMSYRELAFHLHEHEETNWKEYRIKYNIKLSEDIPVPEFKTCLRCGISKPIGDFFMNKESKDGHHRYCSSCSGKEGKSYPNYYYTKDYSKRLYRFNFNKGKLEKRGIDVKNKTEFQIMDEMGYDKIWDCGSTRYAKEVGVP